MSDHNQNKAKVENQILSALPESELGRLTSHLKYVELPYGHRIYAFQTPIDDVYFLNSGMVSLLSTTEEGNIIEVGMVGNEGMIGIPIIMGARVTPYEVIVQAQGTAMKIRGDLLRAELHNRGKLQDLLLHYTYSLILQLSQSAVCNRFHSVEKRLCRWLLTTRDRVKSDNFRLTHEFMAHMLGSRRQGVTESANALQKAGLITYNRGYLTILNSKRLELTSCECYKIIKDAHVREYINLEMSR